jgi:TRAP-type C4-dicarboxylate transport system permease small subunit
MIDESDASERGDARDHRGGGGLLSTACYAIGGFALLAAMATDFVSVVTRHFGFGTVGALEIVQYCIVGAISAAIVIATLNGAHAAVHLLVERVGPATKRALHVLSDVFTALFFAGVLIGDIWLASDVWNRDERSDLLGLPIAPARIIWCVSLGLALVAALTEPFRHAQKEPRHGA